MAPRPAKRSPLSFSTDLVALTPHATDVMPSHIGFIVGVGGTMAVRAVDSSADVSLTVVAGYRYDFALRHIRVTGTTATGIVGYS